MFEQWRIEKRGATADEQAWIDAEAPKADPTISLIAEAWSDVQSCRSVGMSIGPVPWTAVVAWADFWGLDREATILLKRTLRVVEYEVGKSQAAKAEAEAARAEKRKAAGK